MPNLAVLGAALLLGQLLLAPAVQAQKTDEFFEQQPVTIFTDNSDPAQTDAAPTAEPDVQAPPTDAESSIVSTSPAPASPGDTELPQSDAVAVEPDQGDASEAAAPNGDTETPAATVATPATIDEQTNNDAGSAVVTTEPTPPVAVNDPESGAESDNTVSEPDANPITAQSGNESNNENGDAQAEQVEISAAVTPVTNANAAETPPSASSSAPSSTPTPAIPLPAAPPTPQANPAAPTNNAVNAQTSSTPTQAMPATPTPASTAQTPAPKPAPTTANQPAVSSILDIQPYAKTVGLPVDPNNGAAGNVRLTNINPNVNSWYLMRKQKSGGLETKLHLQNPYPQLQRYELDPANPFGVRVIDQKNNSTLCDFSTDEFQTGLRTTRAKKVSFYEACKGKVIVRNKVAGRQTAKEYIAEFLRENVWGAESITTFVKQTFFKDKFMLAPNVDGKLKKAIDANVKMLGSRPREARVDAAHTEVSIEPAELGIELETENGDSLQVGQWYNAKNQTGIYLSAIEPQFVDQALFSTYKDRVVDLDKVERKALVYLVAFDMSAFDINLSMGTKHPTVDWSPRARENAIDRSKPGPDGFGTTEPLITTGRVSPHLSSKVVATFTGGFKRTHGAFKWGTLASTNQGSHYGFVSEGVIFSRLMPNLATMYVDLQGQLFFDTWKEAPDATISRNLKHARQNGVPIIAGYDDEIDAGIPGKLINRWGQGNWSGSVDSKQRALRAAACLQVHNGRQYLIYGYFSSATPSAMARVFQAYRCRYAMHLDMNALEHTYLAIYHRDGGNYKVQNLIDGMKVLDSKYEDQVLPRFIGIADNRDFFYLTRKPKAQP